MKKLFVIRHAKSSWDIGVLSDFDRTLNERGHQNAPEMAKRLQHKGVVIDAFVSSPAKRAFTTAVYFATTYNTLEQDIIQIPNLYHAEPNIFFDTIAMMDDALNNIAIFSHNPGITEFVNMLTTTQIDDMPTCGVFAVEIDITSWKEFKKAKKKFLFFDYPKAG